MNYEQAIVDATLAHNIYPTRSEAYLALSDFYIATNDLAKALQVLSILKNDDKN